MKKSVKALLILLTIFIFTLCGALTWIFFYPETVINTATLRYVLDHTNYVKDVTWKKGEMHIGWTRWYERPFSGRFEDLCLHYENPDYDLQTCIKEIAWDLNVKFDFFEGFSVTSPGPAIYHAQMTKLVLKENKDEKESPLPDIKSYWYRFWGPIVPDLSIQLPDTQITSGKKHFAFDASAKKIGKNFTLDFLKYHLAATPKKIEITGPQKFDLPFSFFKETPLYLRDLKLTGDVDHKGIAVELTSVIVSSGIKASAFVPWPEKSLTSISYQEKILETLKARLFLENVKTFYEGVVPLKYAVLPAPLNVMNGSIDFTLDMKKLNKDGPLARLQVAIDLKSLKQALDVGLILETPIDLRSHSIGAIDLSVDFRKVTIQLPRLSKKELPPQFKPDSRIYHTPYVAASPEEKKKIKEKKLDLDLEIEATGKKALHLRTNLLDENLRLNLSLVIKQGELSSGYVQILPLKTTVFKRPVLVKNFKFTFRGPLTPLIEGDIEFPLPSYRVFMHVEGPMDDPRYSFSSTPPLPKDDIYSVLLFGRTMADLGIDDQNSVRRTNQILTQGVFSLAVLYFLAGSPVQYVGYDPETGNGIAQVAAGKNNSFTVKGRDGYNSASVRRAIGRGWYIDTSSETSTTNPNGGRSYGVMLERIIAY